MQALVMDLAILMVLFWGKLVIKNVKTKPKIAKYKEP